MAGLPAVVLIDPKYPHNVGAALRACSCFDVPTLFWTGMRVDPEKYRRLPREERMKGYKCVQFKRDDRPFDRFAHEAGAVPVCVEVYDNSEPLTTFVHPENAVYVFGPEDGYVPQAVRKLCHRFVHIPAHFLPEPGRCGERGAGTPPDVAADRWSDTAAAVA